MNLFSYDYYVNLIEMLKNEIPILDFSEIKTDEKAFFILRHDVEFSVEKAYHMARIEHDQLKITTSYFFQIRNNIYNPLSSKNANLVRGIYEMGHKIGLHVNMSGWRAGDNLVALIQNDVEILKNGLQVPIDRFSFHRPSHDVLKTNIRIDGLINVYEKAFFHFFDEKPPAVLKVHYFSDSEHCWKYGDPISVLEKPIKKIQLLIHPYSWSETGLDNIQNFKDLIRLKYTEILNSMSDECRHFPKELYPNEKL